MNSTVRLINGLSIRRPKKKKMMIIINEIWIGSRCIYRAYVASFGAGSYTTIQFLSAVTTSERSTTL